MRLSLRKRERQTNRKMGGGCCYCSLLSVLLIKIEKILFSSRKEVTMGVQKQCSAMYSMLFSLVNSLTIPTLKVPSRAWRDDSVNRAFATLAVDLNFVPRDHMAPHNLL